MKPTSRPERRALGLIAATRIAADVDFLVKLALGVTVGARYYHPALQRFIAEDPRIYLNEASQLRTVFPF